MTMPTATTHARRALQQQRAQAPQPLAVVLGKTALGDADLQHHGHRGQQHEQRRENFDRHPRQELRAGGGEEHAARSGERAIERARRGSRPRSGRCRARRSRRRRGRRCRRRPPRRRRSSRRARPGRRRRPFPRQAGAGAGAARGPDRASAQKHDVDERRLDHPVLPARLQEIGNHRAREPVGGDQAAGERRRARDPGRYAVHSPPLNGSPMPSPVKNAHTATSSTASASEPSTMPARSATR